MSRRHRRLQDRRRLTGLSQTELAEMLGTNQGVISRLENYGPKTDRETRLADEIDDLLPPLPPRKGEVTNAQLQELTGWLDQRIQESDGLRKTVAIEMRSRLREIGVPA